jgi:hypothetical protein
MNLQQEILNQACVNLAREMDQSIIDTIAMETLIRDGWTQTKGNPAVTDMGMMSGRYEAWYSQTAEWIHLNATGDYKLIKGQWLFEKGEDATAFLLKWS